MLGDVTDALEPEREALWVVSRDDGRLVLDEFLGVFGGVGEMIGELTPNSLLSDASSLVSSFFYENKYNLIVIIVSLKLQHKHGQSCLHL